MAMPSGEIEKIGMCLVEREFDRIVLHPSGSADEGKRFETLGDGLEGVEFHGFMIRQSASWMMYSSASLTTDNFSLMRVLERARIS